MTYTYIIFAALSILTIAVSWRTVFNIRSHGFYRTFSWLCIAWLFARNYSWWFDDPLDYRQIISWILLILSVVVVMAGVVQMKKRGRAEESRKEKNLYHFEQTTRLVDSGIFRYIRHPLYASLLYLTWGIFFKHITSEMLIISLLSTIFLLLTAFFDEAECMVFFGDAYKDYMKRSKRFIPFIY